VNLDTDSDLGKLLNKAIPLKPADRATLVEESDELESAHASAATSGETDAPEADASIDLHYVCFVKSNKNNLWELDGSRKGPLLRGELHPDDDVLSEKALELGVRRFLKREQEAGAGDLRFSLIALCPSFE
jgi:ubiquitin carboxyl-terminal hydrolase L3